MCPPRPGRERAQTALGVLAASTGARLGALGREWNGWRSSAGAQRRENHAARFTLSKNLLVVMRAAVKLCLTPAAIPVC